VTDTIKRIAAPGELAQTTLEDLDRRLLWAMETPQVFRRKAIVEAYASHGQGQTDDTAVYAAAGGRITVVHNPHPNPKLTVPADLPYFETLLQHPNFS
jgi:2-C-methyl-D-erythritol 4-phosphate cytidylyltransferase